jgi:CheY-like chemotaxis protein
MTSRKSARCWRISFAATLPASKLPLADTKRLQLMAKREYDAILTDLRMPEMDGPEFYRQIEQRWPQRARLVVFITGDALSPTVQTFLAGTGQPYLEKPFVPAEVRKVVQEIVSAAALKEQTFATRS